jgi:hypothetical protein
MLKITALAGREPSRGLAFFLRNLAEATLHRP